MSIRANRYRPEYRPVDPETLDRIQKRLSELNEARDSKPYDMTDEDYYAFLKKKGFNTSKTERDWLGQHEYWEK